MIAFCAWALLIAGAGLLAHAYAVYPAVTRLRAKWRRGGELRRAAFGGRAVAVMSARGEGARLAGKIRELLDGAPVSGLAGIRVGLDGAPEEEARRLREALPPGSGGGICPVEVVAFSKAIGKSGVLGSLLARGGADAWVMMDVRQEVPPESVRALLECLADPAVAVVSGELRYRAPENADAASADAYWSHEKALREAESAVGSVPGATGALYAIRAGDTIPPPPGVVLDDVWIPMQAVLRGKRCLFLRGAVAWDDPETDLGRELARKRRTNAGVWQLCGMVPGVLVPWKNPAWFAFVSHKVCRVLTPFATMAAVAGAVLGAAGVGGAFWWLACGGALAGVAAGAAAEWARTRLGSVPKTVALLAAAWRLQGVLWGAAMDAARGRYPGRWRG